MSISIGRYSQVGRMWVDALTHLDEAHLNGRMAADYLPPFVDKNQPDFVAYHGTSLANGETIEETQEFKIPEQPNNGMALGRGVYFWKEEFDPARLHAEQHFAANDRCVLEATLTPGVNCDRDDDDDEESLNYYRDRLAMEMHEESVSVAAALSVLASLKLVDSAQKRRIWDWGEQKEAVVVCIYNMGKIEGPCITWTPQ